jgi:hypothetical protein
MDKCWAQPRRITIPRHDYRVCCTSIKSHNFINWAGSTVWQSRNWHLTFTWITFVIQNSSLKTWRFGRPRCQSRRWCTPSSAAAHWLELRVGIPRGAWMSVVNVLCRHVRGPCNGPILRPEESYRVCVCHWVWSSTIVTLYSYKEYLDRVQTKRDLGVDGGIMKMSLRKAVYYSVYRLKVKSGVCWWSSVHMVRKLRVS